MEFVQDRITTLHNITDAEPEVPLDRVAVVVPVMGPDLERRGIHHVLSTLAEVDPGRVILSARGDRASVRGLARHISSSDLAATVIWCNAPRLEQTLARSGLDSPTGKGLDVWLGMAIAADTHDIVVVHDADSRTYSTRDVPRLAWPIAQGFDFSKGYYARVERNQLFGRLVRLVWFPIMRALADHHTDAMIDYLQSFRYPLAGEFAVHADHVPALEPYPTWGLETGMLGDMYGRAGIDGSAQVDLGMHRHDHRPVRGEDGLLRMAREVVGTLFDILARSGIAIDPAALAPAYERTAREFVDRYARDAAFNELSYDRSNELDQVATYRGAIATGGTTTPRLPQLSELSIDADRIVEAGRLPPEQASTRGTP